MIFFSRCPYFSSQAILDVFSTPTDIFGGPYGKERTNNILPHLAKNFLIRDNKSKVKIFYYFPPIYIFPPSGHAARKLTFDILYFSGRLLFAGIRGHNIYCIFPFGQIFLAGKNTVCFPPASIFFPPLAML
jgi:hypothetical protein